MKISFLFTDKPDISQVPADDRYYSRFEVPDTAKSLCDIQEQLIAIGELVGQVSNANLHINCADIGLKNYSVKQVDEPSKPNDRLFYKTHSACLYFEGSFPGKYGATYMGRRVLKIYSPPLVSFPSSGIYDKGYRDFIHISQDPMLAAYTQRLKALSDQLLTLLNTDGNWRSGGFHPYLYDKSLATLHNNRSKKWRAEDRKRQREEEKRKAREAKLAEKRAADPHPVPPLTHGSGRTVGARPGIYGGVQMRSQLEIRFAAELDERAIKWVYEGEALGGAGYLVDFYLPDLGVWVEVKGRFEARDRQVLPEVAKFLKSERKHRLLVYTGSGKCFVVNPSGFREVERRNFWGELLR
ncbi:MAG: hypothetical protein GC204_04200 [Chloroflexi bacterium]|nr:hypothetical protein [Chloroflexota bacterium]